MINRERLVNEFVELVSIDSITFKERLMADRLKEKLYSMGYLFFEDDTASKISGEAGNIICTIKGEQDIPGIIFLAHMDTVVPGLGKQAIINGDIIKSDGTTVLGADDLAGVVTILESLRILKEEKIKHGDINIIFTVAEEGGLFGSKNLDLSKINAKYAFVLDNGGKVGTIAIRAPSQNKIDIRILGKAAHAGIEPEKGIDAIQIAAHAISKINVGKIDEETTANIGIIRGGQATNIICDFVELKAEVRSLDMEKLNNQTNHMYESFVEVAEKFGGEIQFYTELMYSSFSIKEDDEIVKILKNAASLMNIELIFKSTGGGSDTNIINEKGIPAVNIGIGMENVHSIYEQISINNMMKTTEFIIKIISSVEIITKNYEVKNV